jgi:DNA-binding Lrp family transcriptional regulator
MPKIDEIDKEILQQLRSEGRKSAGAIAESLGMTAGAVRRRIARLEKDEVIAGYTAVINHEKVDRAIEAYVLLTFRGRADVQTILEKETETNAEVREFSTLAGDPDAMVRVRVTDVSKLREVVTKLREMTDVTGSKTLVALGRQRNIENQPKL